KEPARWKPIAGGTDLMVLFESGKLKEQDFLNLWGLSELRGIKKTKDALILGTLTTYSDVRRHSLVEKHFPMLTLAARATGAIAIQHRGTLGGNIVNASPAADSPPVLLAYEAKVELTSKEGSRWIPYSEFHLGYKKTALRSNELLTRISLPFPTS